MRTLTTNFFSWETTSTEVPMDQKSSSSCSLLRSDTQHKSSYFVGTMSLEKWLNNSTFMSNVLKNTMRVFMIGSWTCLTYCQSQQLSVVSTYVCMEESQIKSSLWRQSIRLIGSKSHLMMEFSVIYYGLTLLRQSTVGKITLTIKSVKSQSSLVSALWIIYWTKSSSSALCVPMKYNIKATSSINGTAKMSFLLLSQSSPRLTTVRVITKLLF